MSQRHWRVLWVAVAAVICGCNGGGGNGNDQTPGSPGVTGTTPNAANAVPIVVDGGPPAVNGTYLNAAFTSVTVCVPGSRTNCQTINHILVDTGSFGLRLVAGAGATTLSLPSVSAGSGVAAECLIFGDGASSFGPLVAADVYIGGEVAPNLTVQLIGGSAGGAQRPGNCPDQSVADSVSTLGVNGILGVGVLRYDCGTQCTVATDNGNPGTYYSCASGFCSPTAWPLASQVQNPVVFFATDNNGVLVDLPALPNHASVLVSGTLFFGVGTRTNNALNASVALTTDPSSSNAAGEIDTVFPAGANGVQGQGLIDTGSNAYFFAPGSADLPYCGTDSPFFCPPAPKH